MAIKMHEEEQCTSNLSSSSKMGWVAEVSSLCLDCQEVIKKKYIRKGREISMHVELAMGRPHE